MEPRYAEWKRKTKAYVKGTLRRQSDALLPSREIREYRSWLRERLVNRKARYTGVSQPGLFSILTPVWNGSPLKYLGELAKSVSQQNGNGACEWVVLDNGCSNRKVLAYLKELSGWSWVKMVRSEENLGITRGLRRCLEEAGGRYILPVDGDDLLFPDALQVLTICVAEAGFPALMYTDEDKIIGSRHYQPYFKPDWDPVLLLNSAYTAHLGVIDRRNALDLGAYSDPATEGSPDWDLFVRFLIAGFEAVHIPEIVYSWRVHARSTADDDAVKTYIGSSQRKVLQRFLDAHPAGSRFELENSPLLKGGAHWHFRRRQQSSKPFVMISPGEDRGRLERARAAAEQDGFVCFVGEDLRIENQDWQWEAMGITELHPDTVMVGGRIQNSNGRITEAGLQFENGTCSNPNRGKRVTDPGYFGQIWKQRTIDAVSTQFAVVKARFLLELMVEVPREASLYFLGAWAGVYAAKTQRRVVYTPFLSGTSDTDWEALVSESERALFAEQSGIRTLRPSTGRQS